MVIIHKTSTFTLLIKEVKTITAGFLENKSLENVCKTFPEW